MDTPFLKGSVFDALMSTFTIVGFSLELICTSLTVKWADGSHCDADGAVISPEHRKPKKHKQHAAHSIILSGSCADSAKTA